MVELNECDIEQLEIITEALESTLEITDIYITNQMVKDLKRIVRNIKNKRENKIC